MKSALKMKPLTNDAANDSLMTQESLRISISDSFQKMAPFWPLKNLIAVNPLQGLEDLSVEEALATGAAYFQRPDLPEAMIAVNRETLKWCQAFFDEGQATFAMPSRHLGLFHSWRLLSPFDARLTQGKKEEEAWLNSLPLSSEETIELCLSKLAIPFEDQGSFLTLMLTTLPGWAAHVKYRTEWTQNEPLHPYPVSQADYLALRLVITCLLWPEASDLLLWHKNFDQGPSYAKGVLAQMQERENLYALSLFDKLKEGPGSTQQNAPSNAQLVFCIDVRSEPLRRALEQTGSYETFGFAGFFGIPVRLKEELTGESYNSCPVLLAPKQTVKECHSCPEEVFLKSVSGYQKLSTLKSFYQSLKYTFSTPFALVETLGLFSGFWMGMRTFSPRLAQGLKNRFMDSLRPPLPVEPALRDIAFDDQCAYGEGALRLMGLTSHFAPLIVFCGHGSATQNNAYATALDCGACGGHHGGGNAKILAAILNNPRVRLYLAQKGILVPQETCFVAAEHNTTTDRVEFYDSPFITSNHRSQLASLQQDLCTASSVNSQKRLEKMGDKPSTKQGRAAAIERSVDWAQVRPEWGLAKNAAFIVGPRSLTQEIDLEGRSFLHSYEWNQDHDGSLLTVILTAPMVVAQWINNQYLFSTLDNVAYGAGSKVTKNITGKIGIMQGNASDLMHGLPLQSVYRTDEEPYHEPLRLLTIVYAPRQKLDAIIAQQGVLKKLFGNGWVQLAAFEPLDGEIYLLQRDLNWSKLGAN